MRHTPCSSNIVSVALMLLLRSLSSCHSQRHSSVLGHPVNIVWHRCCVMHENATTTMPLLATCRKMSRGKSSNGTRSKSAGQRVRGHGIAKVKRKPRNKGHK